LVAGQNQTGLDFGLQNDSSVLPMAANAAPFGTAPANLDLAFVTGLYHLVLGRGPDTAGLTSWVNGLQGGALDFAQVVSGFYHSEEYFTRLVESYYEGFLDRAGEESGVAGWVHALQSGRSAQDVARAFFASPEYTALHPDNTDFVRSLYHNVLGREPDPSGLASWVASLDAGVDRATVAASFLTSTEADLRAINALYLAVLARQGESAGVDGWLASLQNGSLSLADLASAFLTSPEFLNRAGSVVG
jgi:hypothetical protein